MMTMNLKIRRSQLRRYGNTDLWNYGKTEIHDEELRIN